MTKRPNYFPRVHGSENCSINGIWPCRGQEAAVKALRDLTKLFDDRPTFALTGPAGTGKTYLALAAWETRTATYNGGFGNSARDQYGPLFIRWAPFIRALRLERHWWQSADFAFAAEQVAAVCVDDLPAPADALETDVFKALVHTRYEACCGMGSDVSLTTNMTGQQIRQAFGDRVYDRLRDEVLWLVLDGPSHRRPITPDYLEQLQADIDATEVSDAAEGITQ